MVRPYEQQIMNIIGEREYRFVIEPFAGVARASRLLLDHEKVEAAFINDLEAWPASLLTQIDLGKPDHHISPRITDALQDANYDTDDLFENYLDLWPDYYAHRVFVTGASADKHLRLVKNLINNPDEWLLIMDAPFTTTDTEITDYLKHFEIVTDVIIFRPRVSELHRISPLRAIEFEGDNQPETVYTNIT